MSVTTVRQCLIIVNKNRWKIKMVAETEDLLPIKT